MKWEELPFRERAEYIKVGVKNGLRSLEEVKNAYHKFQDGGNLFQEGGSKYTPPTTKVEADADALWKGNMRGVFMDLIGAGVDQTTALGLAGNIALESSGDPNSKTSGKGKFQGLTQNEPFIRNYIEQTYGDYSKESQLNFIYDGLSMKLPRTNKNWKQLHNRFRRFNQSDNSSPSKAAENWERAYEISNQGVGVRKAYADRFSQYAPTRDKLVSTKYGLTTVNHFNDDGTITLVDKTGNSYITNNLELPEVVIKAPRPIKTKK